MFYRVLFFSVKPQHESAIAFFSRSVAYLLIVFHGVVFFKSLIIYRDLLLSLLFFFKLNLCGTLNWVSLLELFFQQDLFILFLSVTFWQFSQYFKLSTNKRIKTHWMFMLAFFFFFTNILKLRDVHCCCFFLFWTWYCYKLNRLNITFICTEKPKIYMTHFIVKLALLW